MNRLLYAGFARLRKDTFFRIALFFMLMTGFTLPISCYFDMKRYGYYISVENNFPSYVIFMSLLVPAFVSLFIGTDYSDGTIRNKLMIGHTRAAVYLSNLTVSAAAGLILCAAYLAAYLAAGIPLLGRFTVEDPWIIPKFTGCSFLLSLSVTALCTLVSMLKQSRALCAVICLLGSVLMLTAGIWLSSALDSPEYFVDHGFYYIGADTGEEHSEADLIPNPSYISGRKRAVYQFLLDFLPGGQVVTLTNFDLADLPEKSLYSAFTAVTATALGLGLFRKKDIK